MSSVKHANWLNMYPNQNFYKRNYEKFIKHHHKGRLFQTNTIPIDVTFSRDREAKGREVDNFFCFGILGWQDLNDLKSLKAYYYNEKRLFSPIIKAQLSRSLKSFKIMTTVHKSRYKSYLFRSFYFKINFIKGSHRGVSKNRLKPMKPWILFDFYQFPYEFDFLMLTKRDDFIAHNQNFKTCKENKTGLTFYDLTKPVLKNHHTSSFLKRLMSRSLALASYKHEKPKHLLWLSSKPKYQKMTTIPKKIVSTLSIKNRAVNFFFKRDHVSPRFSPNETFKRDQWSSSASSLTLNEATGWHPTLRKIITSSSTNLTKTSHLTYSSEFYIPVQIIDQISKKMYLRWLLLVDLPIQTKRGHFIINGYPKAVIHQIVRSPGIRFKNEDNQILADIISMRGAWMGIQIVYDKNVKAANVGFKSQASTHLPRQTKQWGRSQNKTINKSMFQNNFNDRLNNLTRINQNKTKINSNYKNNRFATPRGNFFFQPSRYEYQTHFIQNAIIKSEKIDHLPPPTKSLLKAKHENKAIKNFKHWPKAFFYSQATPLFSIQAKPFKTLQIDSLRIIKSGLNDKFTKILTRSTPENGFKFPLNSIKESEKIHEALSINFFISSSRTDKTDKKRIQLSGFAFLDYLFDHPYFVYNNYVPSWQRSSFFPTSVFLKSLRNINTSLLERFLDITGYREPVSSFKRPLDYSLVSEKTQMFDRQAFLAQNHLPLNDFSPLFSGQTKTPLFTKRGLKHISTKKGHCWGAPLDKEPWQNPYESVTDSWTFWAKENYPPYFTTNDTFLKTLTWRFLKKIKHTRFSKLWPCLMPKLFHLRPLFKIYPLVNDLSQSSEISLIGVAKRDKLTRDSFLVENSNQNRSLEDFTIQAPLDLPLSAKPWGGRWWGKTNGINNGKVSIMQNQNPILWAKTPKSYNGFSNIIWGPNETMYKKSIRAIKNYRTIKSKACLNYNHKSMSLYYHHTLDFLHQAPAPFLDIRSLPSKTLRRYNSWLGKTSISVTRRMLVSMINKDRQTRLFSINGFKLKAKHWGNLKNLISLPIMKLVSKEQRFMPIIKSGLHPTTSHRGTCNLLKNKAQFDSRWIKLPVYSKSNRKSYNEILREKFIRGFSYLPYQNQNNKLWILPKNHASSLDDKLNKESYASLDTCNKQVWTNEFMNKNRWFLGDVPVENTISSNRLLGSLVSILNRTNFRDVLFERFMNAKFYDIGLMGRKRLNKKLRLNIPLQCTTLTPLDFLAIFYKLFSLYNNFSLIQNFFPTEGRIPVKTPFLGDSLALNSKVNPWSESKNSISDSPGSVTFRELMSINLKGNTLPLALPGIGNVFKPRHNLLDNTPLSGSLDHLNQRHVRTSGEFLFLQFWRAILRFYQVLSQLSSRSNFIKSSYTAAGKTGRNFFSLSSVSLFPSRESSISNQTEYTLPTSNNQTHVLKAYGYLNTTNLKDDTFNFNLYQYQCFQNTMSGEFVVRPRLSFQGVGKSSNRNERVEPNSNNTSLSSNKITGSYANNFAKERLNIVINRNDLNSILPYTPYLQTQKTISTYAQFQNFALRKNERDFAYARSSKSLLVPSYRSLKTFLRPRLFWKSQKRQNLRSNEVENGGGLIFQTPSYLMKERKKIRQWLQLTKTDYFLSSRNKLFNTQMLQRPMLVYQNEKNNPDRNTLPILSSRSLNIDAFKIKAPTRVLFGVRWWGNRRILKSERSINKASQMPGLALAGPSFWLKNSVSNVDKPPFNSKIETVIKKLCYETKELRVFDAKERMRNLETKLFNGVFKEFFNLDPLSQDLDETNGLSEIIHKRRISALGKGGVTSKNAPLSIRSIHPSFYGRLCPIDSPEGDRVGLINSLTNYARINSTGYIATPFYRTRQHDHIESYINQKHERVSFKAHPLLAKKSTLQMRLCPPVSFFGTIRNPSKIFPSLRFSFQDITYNLGKINETIKWKIPSQSYAKQVVLQIGSNQFSRTYKSFIKSSYLCPDPLKSFKPKISLLGRKSITGNPFIYRSKQNHFKSTRIHDFRTSLSPIPSFGSIKSQQRELVDSDFLVLPRNLKETTIQAPPHLPHLTKPWGERSLWWGNFSNFYEHRNSIAYKNSHNRSRQLELFLFYDTHYMTPPITHHETIINNAKDKNMGHVYTPFLTSYFDFISYQGYAPISAFQFFSPGVGLIPFLEHDDGTRALMGANMQRQAVPLISASRPIVGTGLEKNIAASFIISSNNSGYLYYISGKQSKQIVTNFGFRVRLPFTWRARMVAKSSMRSRGVEDDEVSNKIDCFKTIPRDVPVMTINRLIKETQFLDELSLKNLRSPKIITSLVKPVWINKTSVGADQKSKTQASPDVFGFTKTWDGRWWVINRFGKQTKKANRFLSLPSPKWKSILRSGIKNDRKMLVSQPFSFQLQTFRNLNRFAFSISKIETPLMISRLKQQKAHSSLSSLRAKPWQNSYQAGTASCAFWKNIKPLLPTPFKNGHHFILNTHWLPYRKSYKATIINKKPAVSENSWLQKGDLLVDGTSSINGELALGRNLFSIYMPWEGYNFEDAILISDQAAKSYTTIHVEEFSVKISKNEFVSSIVKPFTWVNLGDILVSKKRKLENEFIMNRLLFGMSSKPKIKNHALLAGADNDSVFDSESNYTFYGNKPVLNRENDYDLPLLFEKKQKSRRSSFNNRETLVFEPTSSATVFSTKLKTRSPHLSNFDAPGSQKWLPNSFNEAIEWEGPLVGFEFTKNRFKNLKRFKNLDPLILKTRFAAPFLNGKNYVISPWPNKFFKGCAVGNYYMHIPNFTRPVTIINQSNKGNWNRDPKFKLPPSFYYPSKLTTQYFNIRISLINSNAPVGPEGAKKHGHDRVFDNKNTGAYIAETGSKIHNSKNQNLLNQTTGFDFFKTKPNNRLKTKSNYETGTKYNLVDMCKSQLVLPFEGFFETHALLAGADHKKTWQSKNKQFDVGVFESSPSEPPARRVEFSFESESQLSKKKTYRDNPYFLFIPPLFHICYSYESSLIKSWLYNATRSFVSLHSKKKFTNRFLGHKKKDSKWFLPNFQGYYSLQNLSELDSPFSKVRISGETSSIIEQSYITEKETQIDNAMMFDDKQSSLVRMNEKDPSLRGLLGTQPSMGASRDLLKKNDNFEIDTSYRTGESICGWVISVKSQYQNSLFSDLSNKDRIRVLDTKTRMLEQTHSKDSSNRSIVPKLMESQLLPSLNGKTESKPDQSINRSNDSKYQNESTHHENLSIINTESISWPSLKPVIGIYTGSIKKFLSLLSVFPKNAACDPLKLKNHMFHESHIKEPITKRFRDKQKLMVKSSPVGMPRSKKHGRYRVFDNKNTGALEKISPIGYLLLKRNFKVIRFAWEFVQKPNHISLEWLVNNSTNIHVFNAFRPLYSSNSESKSGLLNVNNPYNIPRIKTEPTKLKTTTNLKQPSANDTISIYVAVAKPLQVGDKMSGRHGNKGIISKILPFYDMPYLIDGTPIDIVLNPLGVPSRMNVGQIYESLLGLTGFYKQEYYRIPPFDENYSFQFSRNFVYWKLNELKDLHGFKRSQAAPKIFTRIRKNTIISMPLLSFYSNQQTTRLMRPWFLPPSGPNSRLFKKHYWFDSLQTNDLERLQNLETTKPFGTKRSNQFYDGLNTLWQYKKSSIGSSLNTFIAIDWNTSFLWCSKSKILGPTNGFLKSKSSSILPNKTIYSFGSNLKENWFFKGYEAGFRCFLSKSLSSNKMRNNISFYTPKHHVDTLFINKNRPAVEKFGLNPYFPGKMRLLNGLTGETFYRPIIVGKSYMLKLIHLVHHKIHARATGPYALITQQPLKGKRNQGGQRMGEMEIWALYGFGSASILYEMLTIKSDDPVGRERILREIAGLKVNTSSNSSWKNNENTNGLSLREPTPYWKNEESILGSKVTDSLEKGISESFRVLVMNLRALCLDMQVFKDLPN